jgi:ABC-type polysaccharide/polyol phosphate transport system ATPase subunit
MKPYIKFSNVTVRIPKRIRRVVQKQNMIEDVNLEVKEGERIGIYGPNGSGKTTLLRLVASNLFPDEGDVLIRGSCSAVWHTAASFDFERSARENYLLHGVLRGQRLESLRDREKEVEKFIDIGNFFDVPIKTYSNGMISRMLFTLATQWRPDILIIDEGLPFADEDFQRKARMRLQSHLDKANIVLIASHNLAYLRENCDRIVTLKEGKIIE